MENPELAQVFEEIADLLDIQGANPFRVRAYRTAARTIRDCAVGLAGMPPEKLSELSGIGKDLAGKIVMLVNTGRAEEGVAFGHQVAHLRDSRVGHRQSARRTALPDRSSAIRSRADKARRRADTTPALAETTRVGQVRRGRSGRSGWFAAAAME